MIKWLCSYHQSEIVLETIVSLINKTLKQRATDLSSSTSEGQTSPSPSATLLVAIACQNGAQHSVCFVEKLYERYSSESPLEVGGIRVEVKRKHCEATKGAWIATKDAAWQHSRIPSKHLPKHRDLILNRWWSNFPTNIVGQIEAAFRQDPFATNLDIGKYVIDVESGTMFNKRSRDTFRIRSVIPTLDGKVRSSWQQDGLQDKGHKKFYCSAGILFYSIHPHTGEAVFLLGHITYSSMSWCDFGGMKNFRLCETLLL